MKKILTIYFIKIFALFAISTPIMAAPYINWQVCRDNPAFLCGTLNVPEDYKHPDKVTLELSVAMHPASGKKLGVLLINSGGPWSDDAETIKELFPALSQTIQEHFDIVGFAPRGISPNGITCHSDSMDKIHELDREINLTDPNTAIGAQQYYELTSAQHTICKYDSLSHYAGTKNTIQDIEQLRQALGADKLNYYGGSYGTRLGLAYLLAYPEHVNNMVLDSNVAPTNDYLQFSKNTALATENTLQGFFHFCYQAGTQCAFYQNSPEKIQARYQLLTQVAQLGIPTSTKYANRPFTAAMLDYIVLNDLGDNSTWQTLANELNQTLVSKNADSLMADYINISGYNPINNAYQSYDDNAVFNSVICTDYWTPALLNDKFNWLNTMRTLRQQYPLAGGMRGTYFAKACIQWPGASDPLLPEDPQPVRDANPTVLIVSNTFDPITPPVSAQNESRYLAYLNIRNKILTWEGAGHGAYKQNAPTNGCVDTSVDRFLITGQLPNVDICNDKVNPFEQGTVGKRNYLKSFIK